MLYMVEMDLPDRSKIDAWHAWYEMHIRKLLALPGFHGSQRFFSLTATASPFLAIHHVDGPQFFDSEAYKKVGGPTGTGEWQSRMTNWYRNLFDHPGGWPEVAMADRLAVVPGCAIAGVISLTRNVDDVCGARPVCRPTRPAARANYRRSRSSRRDGRRAPVQAHHRQVHLNDPNAQHLRGQAPRR